MTKYCYLISLFGHKLLMSLRNINNLVSTSTERLGFLKKLFLSCRCERSSPMYLTLLRSSSLSHGCKVWPHQGLSSDLFRLESIQRRATKFIFQDLRVFILGSLKKTKSDSSYWLEIKGIVFFYQCKTGLYDLNIDHTMSKLKKPLHHCTRSRSAW